MTRLSPDEYADLLVARRDAYYVDHPPRPGFPAMLDWFVEDGGRLLPPCGVGTAPAYTRTAPPLQPKGRPHGRQHQRRPRRTHLG